MKDDLENHVTDPQYRLVHWLSITLSLRKTSRESTSFVKKVLPGIFFGCVLYARGQFGMETFWSWTLTSWKI